MIKILVRAWLRTADTAMQIRQKQLRLIIDNLGLVMNREGGLYQSVMTSWNTAMTAMDKLISGSPLVVKEGSILLALSAWHLYPNMSVECSVRRFVDQKDPLIQPGGTLTVGLNMRSELEDNAVSWSLPLAHSRYYGRPAFRTGTSGMSSSRVSFEEFLCAMLGSVMSTWKIPERDFKSAVGIFAELSNILPKVKWMKTLGSASKFCLNAKGFDLEIITRIISYGTRRPEFLAPVDQRPSPGFGLLDINVLLDALKPKEGSTIVQAKVNFLRLYASISPHDMDGALIRFIDQNQESPDETYDAISWNDQASSKRVMLTNIGENKISPRKKRPRDWESIYRTVHDPVYWPDTATTNCPDGPHTLKLPPTPLGPTQKFEFFCGDPNTAAIYRPSKHDEPFRPRNRIRVKDLLPLLRSNLIDRRTLLNIITKEHKHTKYMHSLQAVTEAASVYESLTDARVDLKLLSRPLHSSWFAKSYDRKYLSGPREDGVYSSARPVQTKAKPSNLVSAFCCIALFESGEMDFDPSQLERAMAVSYGDSIFVSHKMLLDPCQLERPGTVRRIVGNVGKPGMAILIPPSTTEMPKPCAESWKVVNHSPFDGQYEDNFAATSLHLHFTGYELPVDIGERGKIDHPAYLLETVVSTYDRGQWVADIDIHQGLSRCAFGWDVDVVAENTIKGDLVSVDSWAEFLDPPVRKSIVRACGNPFARLAIVAVAAQQGYNYRVINPTDTDLPKYSPRAAFSPDFDPSSFSHNEPESPKSTELPEFISATIQQDMFGELYDVDLASEFEDSDFSSDDSGSVRQTSSPCLGGSRRTRSPSAIMRHRSPSEASLWDAKSVRPIMYIC